MSDAQHVLSMKRPAWSCGAEDIMVGGSFLLSAANTLDSGTEKGVGYTVAVSATGVVTITLVNRVHDFKYVVGMLLTAEPKRSLQLTSATASTGVIVFQIKKEDNTSGIAAAEGGADDEAIHWMACVRMKTSDPR